MRSIPGTGAAAEAEVALTTAQGPEVQEFATAVAPVNHALSSDKRSAAAAATATGDDGPRAGDKLTTGDGDGGSGFAGFSPLPPPKRARGLLDEAAQLPSNYLGAIRALELKIVEAQQMQHAVMELRVRAAMQSNRLVLLDNPPLRAHLKKLKAKAQGLMEAVHGSSQAVAASQ